MAKVMIIRSDLGDIVLKDDDIIQMELKINMLNWDRKYNNIAQACFDLYYHKHNKNGLIEVNEAEYLYVDGLTKKTYQECYKEKYPYSK